PEELAKVRSVSGAKDGDLVLAVAAEYRVASRSVGEVRRALGEELRLIDDKAHHAMWIHPFPLFERELDGTWTFSHNPFAGPLDALEYGAPPEGGIATGMDRTVMLLAGLPNARETIAFPKTQTGYDPLLDAPAALGPDQLKELGLRVIENPKPPPEPPKSPPD